jgi:hypothetical protein
MDVNQSDLHQCFQFQDSVKYDFLISNTIAYLNILLKFFANLNTFKKDFFVELNI